MHRASHFHQHYNSNSNFQSVEKKNNEPVSRYENQIIVVAENATFEFSQVLDREFFITKISEILAQVKM